MHGDDTGRGGDTGPVVRTHVEKWQRKEFPPFDSGHVQ